MCAVADHGSGSESPLEGGGDVGGGSSLTPDEDEGEGASLIDFSGVVEE